MENHKITLKDVGETWWNHLTPSQKATATIIGVPVGAVAAGFTLATIATSATLIVLAAGGLTAFGGYIVVRNTHRNLTRYFEQQENTKRNY